LRSVSQDSFLNDILFPDILEKRHYLDLRRIGLRGVFHDLNDAHGLQTYFRITLPGLEEGQAG
jgi:hypothetical protein